MLEVTKETFETEVVGSDKLTLVDFWGPLCGPCLQLMPKVEQLADKYGDALKLTKIEAPKNKRLCLSLKVQSLPTFLLYKNGSELDRLTGDVQYAAIEAMIDNQL